MKREHYVRAVAGGLVITGLATGHFVDPRFLLIPAFVGFNLLQSALTSICPLERILRKRGIGDAG